jgi:transcriptional regulator GlxA family with amidase domain
MKDFQQDPAGRALERVLATSGMSVTDICFEVGFESLGSVSR